MNKLNGDQGQELGKGAMTSVKFQACICHCTALCLHLNIYLVKQIVYSFYLFLIVKVLKLWK